MVESEWIQGVLRVEPIGFAEDFEVGREETERTKDRAWIITLTTGSVIL